MKWVCCIIGITSVLMVDGFDNKLARQANIYKASRAGSRRTKISQYEERKKKCFYVNELFPVTETTCSVKPSEYYYKNLYNASYQTELWEYQQMECLPQKPNFTIVLFYLIIICLWIGFSVNC